MRASAETRTRTSGRSQGTSSETSRNSDTRPGRSRTTRRAALCVSQLVRGACAEVIAGGLLREVEPLVPDEAEDAEARGDTAEATAAVVELHR